MSEEIKEPCNHVIGMATVDYHDDVVGPDDHLMDYQRFIGWKFCPWCGIEVSDLVAKMHEKIEANETAWEKKHGKRLGV